MPAANSAQRPNWDRFRYDPNGGPIEQQMMAFAAGRPLYGTRNINNYQDRSLYRPELQQNGGDDGTSRTVYRPTDPGLRGDNENGVYIVGQDGQDYMRVPWLRTGDNYGVTGRDLGDIGMQVTGWDQTGQDPGNTNFHVDNMHGFGEMYYSPEYGFVAPSSSYRDPDIRRDNWLTGGMFAAMAGAAAAGIAGGGAGMGAEGGYDMFGPGGGLAPEEAAGTGWGNAGGGGNPFAGAEATAEGSTVPPGGNPLNAQNLQRGASLANSLANSGGGRGPGGGGGGGGGGNVRYEWSDEMRPRWQRQLDRSEEISNRPYQRYEGDRYAGLSNDEVEAMANTRNFINNPGDFLYGKGNLYTQGILDGNEEVNPYSGNNPYADVHTRVGSNEYAGENPYFQSRVASGSRDIADTFHEATAQNLARFRGANRRSSAYDQATSQAEDVLAKRLGDFTSGMYSDQYTRSAGLREADIGRRMQNDQMERQTSGNWYDQSQNRGSSAFENARGRQMDATRLAQNDQNLTLDRFREQGRQGALQRGLDQQNRDFDYSQFTEDRDWDRNQAGWLTGMYGQAQGGQNPTQQGGGQGGGSNAMNWLGLGMSALGLYNQWGR